MLALSLGRVPPQMPSYGFFIATSRHWAVSGHVAQRRFACLICVVLLNFSGKKSSGSVSEQIAPTHDSFICFYLAF